MLSGAHPITETKTEIKLSHSFLSNWRQCPRKAWHVNIARDVPREDSVHMAWGRKVHEALDKYLKKDEPLPYELRHYEQLYDFPLGYFVETELKLGMTIESEPCDFLDEHVWLRGIIDVVLTSNSSDDMAILIDHKTGRVREDPEELLIHALLLQTHRPDLDRIKGWYNWLKELRMGKVHDLSDTNATYSRLVNEYDKLVRCNALGEPAFAPQQGPLCGWCPVKQCEFHP